MRWLAVGLSVLAVIVLATVLWPRESFRRTGGEKLILLALLAVFLGVGLAASGWQGRPLVLGIIGAIVVCFGGVLVIMATTGMP